MTSVTLELDDIYKLANDVMLANGCDVDNAAALADIICRAERDGRIPWAVPRTWICKSLAKWQGKWQSQTNSKTSHPAVIQVDGNGCFAPLAQAVGLPLLADATGKIGIAHFHLSAYIILLRSGRKLNIWRIGALLVLPVPPICRWCPAGSKEALFGTNPSHLPGLGRS